jgi:formylmethanofuran dehydrogenase subunit E
MTGLVFPDPVESQMDIKPFLEIASRDHTHLCPRQVLGVRIALKGMELLRFEVSLRHKHLLTISETDGCFIDGLIAVTQCTVGHRSLRVEDYGKVAATFVHTKTNVSIRITPALDVRERAHFYVPNEKRHYFAQLQAYQIMPDDELMTVSEVTLNSSIREIVSYSGARVNCEHCGEEIMNERQVMIEGKPYCRFCSLGGYYLLQKSEVHPHSK